MAYENRKFNWDLNALKHFEDKHVKEYVAQNGPAFDLSAYNAVGGTLATYADLSAALTALNALPAAYKKGGMSFKFVLSSDNKYVQFRCKANAFTIDTAEWVFEGGDIIVEHPEFLLAEVDADNKLLSSRDVETGKKTEYTDVEVKGNLTGKTVEIIDNRMSFGQDEYPSDIFNVFDDKDDRLEVTLDPDNKVIQYRSKDGVLHENAGIDTPMINGANVDGLIAAAKIGIRKNTIYVAASDSNDEDKIKADYVCDGINDEIEINKAIVDCGVCGTVFLFSGNYFIDSFTSYNGFAKSAIVVTEEGMSSDLHWRSIKLEGVRHYYEGTSIHVNESAFNNISDDEQPCVFNVLSQVNIRKSGYEAYWYISLQNLFISLPNWSHNAIIVNLMNAGCGEELNLRLSTFGNHQSPEYLPAGFNVEDVADKLVGITGFHGWTYGDCVRMDNICVWGCRVAFQLGGEHLICNNLRARYNYCGYTFGEYYKSMGADLNSYGFGCFNHPITLINCCDEHSYQGPIFAFCGKMTNYYKGGDRKLQAINFIDFNTEQFTNNAYEVEPNSFCGKISYHPSDGVHGGFVDYKFWENGSGKNFETINLTHPKGGNTQMRMSLYGNYMQRFFDTDLNKELICVKPSSQKWVDTNGNIISENARVYVGGTLKDSENNPIATRMVFTSVTDGTEIEVYTSAEGVWNTTIPLDNYLITSDNYLISSPLKVKWSMSEVKLIGEQCYTVSGTTSSSLANYQEFIFTDLHNKEYKTKVKSGIFSIQLPNGEYSISNFDYGNNLSVNTVTVNGANIENMVISNV